MKISNTCSYNISVIVISLTMIFAGIAWTYASHPIKTEEQPKPAVASSTAPTQKLIFIHGNTFERLDGGLYRNVKTGAFCNEEEVYSPF